MRCAPLFLSGADGLCYGARAGVPVRIDVCQVRFRWARSCAILGMRWEELRVV